MKTDKLHPEAEKALRKLLLEIWSFQTKIEETDIPDSDWDSVLDDSELTKNQQICNFFVDLDSIRCDGLKVLGFDCWEDLEESVWAKKPEEAAV